MEEFIADQGVPTNTTTLLINESLFPESFSRRTFRTALIFDKYYTPLLCLFGTLGNSLSLAVFSTDTKYKNQSASLYLSALAISDTGFLLSLLAVWFESMVTGGGVITSSDFSCSLVMYLGQVTCFLSVYLTVAFTIERYVAVHCPFSKGRIFTRKKAKRCCAILTIIALLICSYAWVIAKVVKYPLPRGHPREHVPTYPSELSIISSLNRSDDNGNLEVLPATMKLVQEDIHVHGEGQGDDFIKDNWNITGELKSGDDVLFQKRMNKNIIQNLPVVSPSRMKDTHRGYIIAPNHPKYVCSVPEAFYPVSEIANYCDTVVTLIIPFLLITFFNIQIATCVWRLKTQRQSIMATQSRDSFYDCPNNDSNPRECNGVANNGNTNNENETYQLRGKVLYRPAIRNNHQIILLENLNVTGNQGRALPERIEKRSHPPAGRKMNKAEISARRHLLPEKQRCRNCTSPELHVTKTLLLVSSVFLILNLPSHLIRCAQFILRVTGTKEGQELLRALQPWANILFNTNFAVNFLLYCVSGRSFRSSLRHLLTKNLRQRGSMQHNHHRHHHHQELEERKMIKKRLNRSFQLTHSRSRCYSASAASLTAGCAHENHSATRNLHIELRNLPLAKDESVIPGDSGTFIKYAHENEHGGSCDGCGEHIV